MALVERLCTHVAVVGAGKVLAAGTIDDVRAGSDLEDRFVELIGDDREHRDLTWLRPS
jgi:ABC-2 type transport system ATP-binding protein